MQTLKIKYKCSKDDLNLILNYQKQYSNCLHYNYNRLKDNDSLTEKDLRNNSSNINNCDLIKSYLMQCSIKEAKQLINNSNDSIISTVLPISTVINSLQLANAESPILVTLSGISIDVIFVL